ncbi:hypothetical protein K435DRAFT_847194 [Dendrothele bispora CBS 962.96]|uniref:Peroxisomal membrane protein PEX14 n=1 Tax=Dendrothele bispora (strain CBS 962.96) TaxID=1314807 RepID=A0A4V4HIY6_DENBC|nr:hypothetical protein K435DRAFT_847194 [Dendrothele bispora CBS 962.96]
MSSDDTSSSGPSQQESQPQQQNDTPVQTSVPSPAPPNDRVELISRARTFLTSPQVRNQDLFAKRTFLLEKGLTEPEIELLLRELPPQLPTIPPRSYPRPPPSRLPVMLLGMARMLTWLAGGTAILLFIYYRFLLPRISRTFQVRHTIKEHQINLLKTLNTSLEKTKAAQSESYSCLPRPQPFKEPSPFSDLHTINDVLTEGERQKLEIHQLPEITLLRCAIEEFRKQTEEQKEPPRTEEIFRVLEGRIPWLVSEEGIKFEHRLWDVLSHAPCFESSTTNSSEETSEEKPIMWDYIPLKPQTPTELQSSLSGLSSTLKSYQPAQVNPYSHTLKTLSDFTGYVSSQLYLPYRPPPLPGASLSIEEELKKDIRALKGLVLNRRTFMNTIPRPSSVTGRTAQ